jgi:hypothetical protein
MLKRTITLLVAATLAAGLFATDAQARGGGGGGGGGGHGGGGGMHMGGGGGMHMGGGGMRMGGDSMRMGGGLGTMHVSGGFRDGRLAHGMYRGRHRGGYSDWGTDCSPYYWQYDGQWPDVCF